MRNLRILSMIMLVAFSFNLSAQTIEGGGGVIALSTGADPNNITAIATQAWASGEAVLAHDAHTGTLWIYDDTNAAAAKWEVLVAGGATTVTYVANTRTLTINGVPVVLPLADGTNAGLLGGVTDQVNGLDIALSAAGIITVEHDLSELTTKAIPVAADILLIEDSVDGTSKTISLSNVLTTVTDQSNGLDIDKTGTAITVEPNIPEIPIEDTSPDADDLFIMYSDAGSSHRKVKYSTIANTDNQTIDVSTITPNTLNISLEDDGVATISLDLSTRLAVYYTDDAEATTGGIGAEQEYKLDEDNPYGQPKGTIRVRQ